ncbi:hypothetical protein KP509_05G055800 [Ceratopteris richardii]|uniref:UVR domain-containing protein n=1 Tax=Ceratopteris richardii TaxID=49495 RepID=A0A8T2UU30_CERRI|nr:hypothetical protein KP509_05G055800 [Ceratopteris richardii]
MTESVVRTTIQGRFSLHVALIRRQKLPKSFCLRRNEDNLCFPYAVDLLISNRSTDQRLEKVTFGTSANNRRSKAKFSPKVWRKDRGRQSPAFIEQSNSATEELLLFFFQLDLATALQRALNLDQYEAAKQLREKMVEVDKEIEKQRGTKLGPGSSKIQAQDKEITILRLKNDLQKAVEAEDYNGAADLRDQISKLEAESLAATARALAFQNVKYSFRLGQKVLHTKYGYRGVICGMDPICSESDNWSGSALIQDLPRGRNQPFYQVLVDMKAEPDLLVAYVAEENLVSPNEPDKENFDHPYISFLFYGMDTAGDYIPIKQLREKYNQPRHELPWEGGTKGDDNGGSGDDNGPKP